MNLHSPERAPNESQAQYRARRAHSNALVAQALKPTNPPHFAEPIGKSANSKRDKHRAKVAAAKPVAAGPKPLPVRKHKPAKHTRRDAHGAFTLVGKAVEFIGGVPRDPRYYEIAADTDGDWTGIRKWRAGEPVHDLNPNRERDASKREKPKSAVAKRMDRPERVALIDRGNTKIMRWFGVAL